MDRRGSGPIKEEDEEKREAGQLITEETVGYMKGKEEDEERNDNICPHTIKQRTNSSNTEATLIPCGSSGERANNRGEYYKRGG